MTAACSTRYVFQLQGGRLRRRRLPHTASVVLEAEVQWKRQTCTVPCGGDQSGAYWRVASKRVRESLRANQDRQASA